jgi:hypothetical protein
VRAAGHGLRIALREEIENGLGDGYAHALAGDAWSIAAQARLGELMHAAERPGGASGLHALAREHGEFAGRLDALRAELRALRGDLGRLRAVSA